MENSSFDARLLGQNLRPDWLSYFILDFPLSIAFNR